MFLPSFLILPPQGVGRDPRRREGGWNKSLSLVTVHSKSPKFLATFHSLTQGHRRAPSPMSCDLYIIGMLWAPYGLLAQITLKGVSQIPTLISPNPELCRCQVYQALTQENKAQMIGMGCKTPRRDGNGEPWEPALDSLGSLSRALHSPHSRPLAY